MYVYVYTVYIILFAVVNLPAFLKDPGPATVNISANVTFSCTAKGFNITDLVWRKVGSSRLPLTATNKTKWSSNEVTSILTITKTAGYYRGKYYCVATNNAGETPSNQAQLLVQGYYFMFYIEVLATVCNINA